MKLTLTIGRVIPPGIPRDVRRLTTSWATDDGCRGNAVFETSGLDMIHADLRGADAPLLQALATVGARLLAELLYFDPGGEVPHVIELSGARLRDVQHTPEDMPDIIEGGVISVEVP